MNWRMLRAELAAAQVQPLHVEVAQLRAELGLGREVGIGDRLLLRRERVPQRPGPGEPEAGRDLQRVVEPGIDRLDDRARRGEVLGRGGDGGGDLGVDVSA